LSNLSDHKLKAANNEALAASLPDQFVDWAVVALFYAAVHYVEAHLAKHAPPVHSANHDKRDNNIASSRVLKPLWKNYRELKNQSRLARYEAHIVFTRKDVNDAKVRLDAIKTVLLPTL
jgi:hypothetical protein